VSDLAVVVVTHQSASDLPRCLESLLHRLDGVDASVVVSDSGSTDATVAVARSYPVHVVPGRNDGFGAGCNRVLGHEAVRDARWVLFLNPDTELVDGSLAAVVRRCDALDGLGVASVRQVDVTGTTWPTGRRYPNAARLLAEAVGGPLQRFGQWDLDIDCYERERDFDWLVGAFLIARRAALDEVGAFDERFFLYSEEVDLCLRIRRAGWRVVHLPVASYRHYKPGRAVTARELHLTYAQRVYAEKWFSRPHRALFRAAIVAKHARCALDPWRSELERRRARARLRGALLRRVPAP
jgi:GT2 family glycosyltransferase